MHQPGRATISGLDGLDGGFDWLHDNADARVSTFNQSLQGDITDLPHNSAGNIHNSGAANHFPGGFDHVHDQESYEARDPSLLFPQSSGAVGQVSGFAAHDDEHLNGFNIHGTYPQHHDTAALFSPIANLAPQTNCQIDPQAVYFTHDLADSGFFMNLSDPYHSLAAEHDLRTDSAIFAAFNPLTLDTGYNNVPAVTAGIGRLVNVDQDASSRLINDGVHPPAAPRIDGERRIPTSRARG